ncbi:glutathione S-transferase family protein [Aspergillus homomorphus CBS 101889]|uniref:glutathione transferase n=1 Tax=Aspergillus homomorphus (strain CBS 101889) TaxID=1450537 RepID=A0A395IFR1_ASPHC|nr:hypothetical protein BO97DRAFT_402588 [Aspergillus homomorphus CBS 101889]RAL17024.1 hypothetical protein BO97DRAFT_402588 [Aspergillus homomorphus CBS 101889]
MPRTMHIELLPTDANAWSIITILEELGIPYTTTLPNRTSSSFHQQLPTLTDPSTSITLSHTSAIIHYLVDRYDHPRVNLGASTTTTIQERYLLNQWLHFQTTLQEVLCSREERSDSGSDEPTSRPHQLLATLDTALVNKTWLVGERCSYADLAFLPGLSRELSPASEHLLERYPWVRAWRDRMETRGSWERVLSAWRSLQRVGGGESLIEKEEESDWEEIEGVSACSVVTEREDHELRVLVPVSVAVPARAGEDDDLEEREGMLPCAAAFMMQASQRTAGGEGKVERHEDDDEEREGILPCAGLGAQRHSTIPPRMRTDELEDEDEEREGILPCGAAFALHASRVAAASGTVGASEGGDDDEKEGILPCGAFAARAKQVAPVTTQVEEDDDVEREGMLPCAGFGMQTKYETVIAEEDDFEREAMPPCSLIGMVY